MPGHRISHAAIGDLLKAAENQSFSIFLSSSLDKTLDPQLRSLASGVFAGEKEAADLNLLLSLGGDGTLLDSLLYTLRNRIPLLGINFGRLGFLPSIPDSEIDKFFGLIRQQPIPVQERSVLELHWDGITSPFADFPYALNEVALIKKDSSSMIHIRTEVDGVFLNEYWGDGLIVSTPTGSTGYSLSCGGPILWPDSSVMVLTPVSPHNLSMRPLVLSDGMKVKLIPGGRTAKIMLSMDSRSKSFPVNQEVNIKKSTEKAVFIRASDAGFVTTLREKLYWGKDYRN